SWVAVNVCWSRNEAVALARGQSRSGLTKGQLKKAASARGFARSNAHTFLRSRKANHEEMPVAREQTKTKSNTSRGRRRKCRWQLVRLTARKPWNHLGPGQENRLLW